MLVSPSFAKFRQAAHQVKNGACLGAGVEVKLMVSNNIH